MSEVISIAQAMDEARRHHVAGQLNQAQAIYSQVLNTDPRHAEAMHLLGLICFQSGAPDRAIALLRRSIDLRPDEPHFYKNLGEVTRRGGLFDESSAAFRRAIELSPQDGSAWHGLGVTLEKMAAFDRAIEAYRNAIALSPNDPASHLNLGVLIEREGQYDEALKSFEAALRLRPDYPNARVARGINLLRRGRMEEAWPDYDVRWKDPHFPGCPVDRDHPLWDGSDLKGKTIVIRCEQGLGDSIQFSRYVPMVVARGGDVIFEVQPELERLMRHSGGFGTVMAAGDARPVYDLQVPLMSLPGVFRTTAATIPAKVPYLATDAPSAEKWGQRLAGGQGMKVGVVWAGNPRYPGDGIRSIRLETMGPLAAVPGVRFYAMQLGEAAQQAKNPPAGMDLADLGREIGDFVDTAAILMQLDLLISVDTSVAHLAGALGREVWTLIPYVPDWRWFMDRAETPWYPTMRLFRQERSGDWDGVMERVAVALKERAGR